MGSGLPSIGELQRPERLHDVLAQDKVDDCTPCRVTGAAAFMGLGAYSYYTGHSQLKMQESKILASKSAFGLRARRSGVTGIALTLGLMGLYRLVN
ncbi:uncharacterized protein LY89DRAFT_89349 [Mollisia scopiformis]|uniref:Distal membrane-arm assembly complex protein 1-like domain-containing protein n=1 Tax=Mollisia scopiformis TaxID=149040 RepID=A0A194X6B4_MOLSC|nr:uncharacterized protein LY89DRAFT_89349 [Mollisia scopiformis]KUJ15609.1 hypothetical protein LY89DRAFT_89349 [Mollisia scopiformis]